MHARRPCSSNGSHKQKSVRRKVRLYIQSWRNRGYPDDIPDEVPDELMRLNLAPSYKAICFALLTNDMALQSLGLQPPRSRFYNELKRLQFEQIEREAS